MIAEFFKEKYLYLGQAGRLLRRFGSRAQKHPLVIFVALIALAGGFLPPGEPGEYGQPEAYLPVISASPPLNREEALFPVFLFEGEQVFELWTPAQPVRTLLAEAGFQLQAGDRVEPEGDTYPRAEIKIRRAESPPAVSLLPGGGLERETALGRGPGPRGGLGEILPEERENPALPALGGRVNSDGATLVQTAPPLSGGKAISGVLELEATAYCPGTPGSGCPLDYRGHALCTGCYNDGYTYTGKKAIQGEGTLQSPRMVAVDPLLIPLGSLLYLKGIGFAVAEDIGGAIQGERIDLLFDLHRDACKFGRQKGITVYLLAAK